MGIGRKLRNLYHIGDTFNILIKQNEELVYAQVWRDTINGIDWIKELGAISPGRWAVGYNYLYVMTRILNEMRPSSVLDIGMGISSSLISAYFRGFEPMGGYHCIVEQDEDWMHLFRQNHEFYKNTEFKLLKIENGTERGEDIYKYSNFETAVCGQKYDLISIDGPKGSPRHSRGDIVPLLGKLLSESFVIVMDDADRIGEQDTIYEIKNYFEKQNVKIQTAIYRGNTDCAVIASWDNRWFCTL